MKGAAFGLLVTFILASGLAAGVYLLVMYFIKSKSAPQPAAVTVIAPEPEVTPWIRTEETNGVWVPLTGAAYPDHDIGTPQSDSLKSCAARCENTSGCLAATFSQDTNQCSMKSKLGKPVANANVTVLVPFAPPYPQAQKPSDDPDLACYTSGEDHILCSALCAVHGDCKATERHDRKSGIWSYGGCCLKTYKRHL